jgi:uracil-DNA glycosylase
VIKKVEIICDGTYCGRDYDVVPAEMIGNGFEVVVLVGEAPFKDEVEQQRPFIGKAGMILRGYLNTEEYRYLILNSIMCKPYDTLKNKPTDELIKACKPVRDDILDMMVEGEIIVCFGRYAQQAIFGKEVPFDTNPYFIEHPTKKWSIQVYANVHPMSIIYDSTRKEQFKDILRATGKFKI